MNPDVICLTRALCTIPSPTGEEAAVVARTADLLVQFGYTVIRQPVSPGRDNLLAYRDHPVVVLSTHLDTVPPHVAFRETADSVYGRGTVDAKGIAAAMMVAGERLAAEGLRSVALLFLVGEEDGSDGALAARSLSPRGRFLINGEPTDNRLVVGQKGALRVRIEARGMAAHSGYPEDGRSAVEPLLDTLAAYRALILPTDPTLGHATLNIGRIDAGVAPNVIPPNARAEVLIRTVGPTEQLRAQLLAAAAPGVTVTFPLEIPAMRSTPLDGWSTSIVSYTSDWPLLANWGAGYQLGPGTIRVAHTDQEGLPKEALVHGVDAYVRLVHHLLTGAPA